MRGTSTRIILKKLSKTIRENIPNCKKITTILFFIIVKPRNFQYASIFDWKENRRIRDVVDIVAGCHFRIRL